MTAHSGNVSSTRQYSITGHATEKSSISMGGWGWVIEDRVSFRDRLGFKIKLGLKLRKGQMLGGGVGGKCPTIVQTQSRSSSCRHAT